MKIKWNFLVLALLATISIGSIGVSIAEKSWIGIVVALFYFVPQSWGLVFTMKEKIT